MLIPYIFDEAAAISYLYSYTHSFHHRAALGCDLNIIWSYQILFEFLATNWYGDTENKEKEEELYLVVIVQDRSLWTATEINRLRLFYLRNLKGLNFIFDSASIC